MRAGFGDERREIHSTHSLQGKLAVVPRRCCSGSAGRCWRGTSRCLSTATSRARCTAGGSSWAAGSCTLMLFAILAARVEAIPRRGRAHHRDALPRHRQALLRVHRVLGLPHLRPVPGDLVRQHGRRRRTSSRLRLIGAVEAGDGRDRRSWCSCCRSSACSRQRRRSSADDDRSSRCRSLVGHVAAPVHRDLSVDLRHDA